MKLEIGKRYVTRGGAITAPLVENTNSMGVRFPFMCPGTELTWTPNGGYYEVGDAPRDLITEYVEPCPLPDLPPGFKATGWGMPKKGDWFFSPTYHKPRQAQFDYSDVHLLLGQVEDPADWVTQDRVPARPGVDQCSADGCTTYVSVAHGGSVDGLMHGAMDSCGTKWGIRCLRKDLPEKPVEKYPKYYAASNTRWNSYVKRTSETEATVYRRDGGVAEGHTTVWKLIETGQPEITREEALALVVRPAATQDDDMDGWMMLIEGVVKKGDQCRVPDGGAWVDCSGSVGMQVKNVSTLEFRRRADAKQEEPVKPVNVEVCHIGGEIDRYIMASRDAVVNAIKAWQVSGGNFLILDDCVINMNTVENVSTLVDEA